MQIINNYPGSAVEILNVDNANNIAYLSLKKEHNSYSHYYNFKVINDDKKGEIHLANVGFSPYVKDQPTVPYLRKDNHWSVFPSADFSYKNGEVVLNVAPYANYEISLYPSYTKKDLRELLLKINKYNFITINEIEKLALTEIIIGDLTLPTVLVIGRQHPGETLSSFFIEGMIEAIIANVELLTKYCFVFYPIINVKGVEQGNHRFSNGIDYNRIWNEKQLPAEIAYLKAKLNNYNLISFIDIHNDEISTIDYVRSNFDLSTLAIDNMLVLKDYSKWHRFLRALIKDKKIIDLSALTAREYVSKNYGCDNILVELATNNSDLTAKEKGYEFIKQLKLERKRK